MTNHQDFHSLDNSSAVTLHVDMRPEECLGKFSRPCLHYVLVIPSCHSTPEGFNTHTQENLKKVLAYFTKTTRPLLERPKFFNNYFSSPSRTQENGAPLKTKHNQTIFFINVGCNAPRKPSASKPWAGTANVQLQSPWVTQARRKTSLQGNAGKKNFFLFPFPLAPSLNAVGPRRKLSARSQKHACTQTNTLTAFLRGREGRGLLFLPSAIKRPHEATQQLHLPYSRGQPSLPCEGWRHTARPEPVNTSQEIWH